MTKGHITFMVVPEEAGHEVRRFRVPRLWLTVVACVGAGLVVASGVLVGLVVYGASMVNEGRRLVRANQSLRSEVVALEASVEKARAAVQRVARLESKLKTMTMVSDPARSLAIGPVGRGGTESNVVRLSPALFATDGLGGAEAIRQRAETLAARAAQAESELTALRSVIVNASERMASTPSRRPTRGYMSSTFGMRVDPFTGLPQAHRGLDFSAPVGTEVRSTADGVVRTAGRRGAYGLLVEVDHGFGLSTRYAHLSGISVRSGQKVERGDPVGQVGNSGRSTGPHLHYEVRINGVPVDPKAFILD